MAPVFELQIAPWPKLTGTSVPVRAPNRMVRWWQLHGCVSKAVCNTGILNKHFLVQIQSASIYFNMLESSKLAVWRKHLHQSAPCLGSKGNTIGTGGQKLRDSKPQGFRTEKRCAPPVTAKVFPLPGAGKTEINCTKCGQDQSNIQKFKCPPYLCIITYYV